MKLIFMGSGEFALHPLIALQASKHKVCAVFTAPDNNCVYSFALEEGLPVFTPTSLRSHEGINLVESIAADILVVASYGKILNKHLLEAKRYGAINVHPSMLPKFRGASPVQSTILSGDERTAVCIIRMDEGVDTGPIIAFEEFKVPDRVHAAELERLCSKLGGEMVVKVLSDLPSLKAVPQEQFGIEPSYALKITKDSGRIFWAMAAIQIERMVRAFSRWPVAYFIYNGEPIRVFDASSEDLEHSYPVGSVLDDSCLIACRKGALRLNKLQRQGRKVLGASEFLRGYKIAKGQLLG